MAKFCPNCGTEMPDEAMFCTNCGSPFPDANADKGNAPKETESANISVNKKDTGIEKTTGDKKKKKPGCLIVIIIVVVVLALLILLIAMGSKDDSSKSTSSTNTSESSEEVKTNVDNDQSTDTKTIENEQHVNNDNAIGTETEDSQQMNVVNSDSGDLSNLIGASSEVVDTFIKNNNMQFGEVTEFGDVYYTNDTNLYITLNSDTNSVVAISVYGPGYPFYGFSVGDELYRNDADATLQQYGYSEDGYSDIGAVLYHRATDESELALSFEKDYLVRISYTPFHLYDDFDFGDEPIEGEYDVSYYDTSLAEIYLAINGISPTAAQFITSNPFLFTTDKETARSHMGNTDPRTFFKSYDENSFGHSLVRVRGAVINISEYDVNGSPVTEFLLSSIDGLSYYEIFVNQPCNIYQGDYVEVIGLPVTMFNFDGFDALGIAASYCGTYKNSYDCIMDD